MSATNNIKIFIKFFRNISRIELTNSTIRCIDSNPKMKCTQIENLIEAALGIFIKLPH